MKKAEFSNSELQSAIAEFTQSNAPRIVPSTGKNGEVTVYGNNDNPHKPTLFKEEENGSDKEPTNIDYGIV